MRRNAFRESFRAVKVSPVLWKQRASGDVMVALVGRKRRVGQEFKVVCEGM